MNGVLLYVDPSCVYCTSSLKGDADNTDLEE